MIRIVFSTRVRIDLLFIEMHKNRDKKYANGGFGRLQIRVCVGRIDVLGVRAW